MSTEEILQLLKDNSNNILISSADDNLGVGSLHILPTSDIHKISRNLVAMNSGQIFEYYELMVLTINNTLLALPTTILQQSLNY